MADAVPPLLRIIAGSLRNPPPPGTAILVGAVGQFGQGDLDFGRALLERLADERHPDGVVLEDLYHGALHVTHDLNNIQPRALVVVGAADRDRPPGTLQRRVLPRPELSHDDVRTAVGEAATGYVSIDLLVEVAAALDVLPEHAVAIEFQPVDVGGARPLSPAARDALEPAAELVRREIDLLSRATTRPPPSTAS